MRKHITIRYAQPRIASRRQGRLVRYSNPTSAEDDYFRFANRGR